MLQQLVQRVLLFLGVSTGSLFLGQDDSWNLHTCDGSQFGCYRRSTTCQIQKSTADVFPLLQEIIVNHEQLKNLLTR